MPRRDLFPGEASCYSKVWAGGLYGFVHLRLVPPVISERIPTKFMKAGIHPAYEEVNVACACGSTFQTRSTHKGNIRVEICSSCHPFFTGRQKLIDTEGRVDRFQKKAAKSREIAAQRKAAADAKKKVQ